MRHPHPLRSASRNQPCACETLQTHLVDCAGTLHIQHMVQQVPLAQRRPSLLEVWTNQKIWVVTTTWHTFHIRIRAEGLHGTPSPASASVGTLLC